MMKFMIRGAMVMVSLFSMVVGASYAEAFTSKQLGTVINLSGKQRMLTQKMSKEVFLIAKGVFPAKNKVALKKTSDLFARTLDGLLKGDKGLRLAKTKNAKILKQLKKVKSMWKPFYKQIKLVLKGDLSKKVLNQIEKRNVPLLKNMNKAVGMYSKLSKKGSLSPAMARTINLAGKQRMLTQKMTKEYFLVALGIKKAKNLKALKGTIGLFSRTLKGLKKGSKKLKLVGTKDAKILEQLKKVTGIWAKYKPVLKGKQTKKNLTFAAKINIPLLKNMNKAVKMYEKSVK